jgi:hypothetical protein
MVTSGPNHGGVRSARSGIQLTVEVSWPKIEFVCVPNNSRLIGFQDQIGSVVDRGLSKGSALSRCGRRKGSWRG